MITFITPKVHGIMDYLTVLFLLASPMLFGLNGFTAIFTYALGVIHLLLTISTDYSVGLFNFIPFPVHGTIELIVGLTVIVLAFTLFKYDAAGKLFYICFGGIVIFTWLFTDYKRYKPFQVH